MFNSRLRHLRLAGRFVDVLHGRYSFTIPRRSAWPGFQRLKSTTSGDFGLIYRPPDYGIENEELSKSVRCCLSGYNQEDHEYYTRDTGMSICFLGTSAGVPTRHRSTSATLLRLGGTSFLFDAGEGVQRQLAFTRAKPSHVERIFITHLHGDHIFGLPGFLLGLQHSIMMMQNDGNKKKKKDMKEPGEHVVKIYGPAGLYNYIASNIILSCTKFHALSIEVYELVGGRVRRSHGGRGVRNPFQDNYPEFNFGFLKRKFIECENGVWIINDFDKLSRQDILSKSSESLRTGERGVRIKAAEVDHLAGISTFGFTIEEDEPARNIDAIRAKKLGVSPKGKKYELLKYGYSVLTDDGSKEVQPIEVLKPRTKRSRKLAIVGDNRAWTSEMTELAKESDVLIHEATLTEEDWNRGHSTAAMAGRLSGKTNSKVLILNHISSKSDRKDIDGNSCQIHLIANAKESSDNKSDVLISYDFMELLVPWMGFGKHSEETSESVEDSDSKPQGEEIVEHVEARLAVKKWFGDLGKDP